MPYWKTLSYKYFTGYSTSVRWNMAPLWRKQTHELFVTLYQMNATACIALKTVICIMNEGNECIQKNAFLQDHF